VKGLQRRRSAEARLSVGLTQQTWYRLARSGGEGVWCWRSMSLSPDSSAAVGVYLRTYLCNPTLV